MRTLKPESVNPNVCTRPSTDLHELITCFLWNDAGQLSNWFPAGFALFFLPFQSLPKWIIKDYYDCA